MAANQQLIVKCKTKLSKDDPAPVSSEVTIVFDDEKAMQAFAARGAVIAWQAIARMAGVIPESDTVNISDMAKRAGGGFKATPQSLANRVKKMSAEDYRGTLIALGLDAKTVDRMCKAYTAPVSTTAKK